MAGANGLLLRALLERGCRIDFFSKPSFVDPRPVIGSHPLFHFHATDNPFADRLRARVEAVPGIGLLGRRFDSFTYHRAILQAVAAGHRSTPFDLFLWLGDYARGRVAGLPNVSFAQGPPGTDARSVFRHFGQIQKLSGSLSAWKWWFLARLRLSRFGRPPFSFSDHIIVGSGQSKLTLMELFGFQDAQVSPLPYPVDLQVFRPVQGVRSSEELRCLWLGRIVPRKRLDLFLDAAALAISRGVDIRLTIAGDFRMVPGYEALIKGFPYPDRLLWRKHVPRKEVPDLLRSHDVLIQPSEEEDFGSSVAEAQACGLPVIVGSTNGNRDYLSSRDIVLEEDSAHALCAALIAMATREESPDAPSLSRRAAKEFFDIDRVADQLLALLEVQNSPR